MVIVIFFSIAAFIFFLFMWILKNYIKTDTTRRILMWAASILFFPIMYLAFIGLTFWIILYEPSRVFNKTNWFELKKERNEMVDDLIESKILENKSKTEVIELIGRPNSADSLSKWTYDLGMSTSGLGFEFNYLEVTFGKDLVTKVEKFEILD